MSACASGRISTALPTVRSELKPANPVCHVRQSVHRMPLGCRNAKPIGAVLSSDTASQMRMSFELFAPKPDAPTPLPSTRMCDQREPLVLNSLMPNVFPAAGGHRRGCPAHEGVIGVGTLRFRVEERVTARTVVLRMLAR